MAVLDSVPGSRITQRFGKPASSVASKEPAMWASGDKAYWLRYPGSTFYAHFHPGIDRAAVVGTPIRAIEAGTVIFSGWRNSTSGYAIEVEIRPGTRYGFNHCKSVPTKAGTKVTRGHPIATIGMTGVTTGPHTHSFISIREKGADGILRTFIYDPALFEEGGRLANNPRIKPLNAPARLVHLKGPGINIRTSPDLDVGKSNLFATSRANGIFAYPSGKQLHTKWATGFQYITEVATDDGPFVKVTGFSRTLFIFKDLVNIK